MKNVVISVLVVGLLAAAIVAVSSMSESTKETGQTIAKMLIGAIPAVHQLLQKSGSRLSLSPKKRGVVSFYGYTMPVVMLALYGILIMLAVPFLVAFVHGGLIGYQAGFERGAGLPLSNPSQNYGSDEGFVMLALPIVAYFVGKLIGVRSESKGLFAILAVAFFAPFIDLLLSVFLKGWAEPGERPVGIGGFLILLLFRVILIGVPAVFGYWRGRVIQSSRYLAYLGHALPQESRDALVNLASDEAKRLASSAALQPGTSPP
jgi:hypothetical protein